MLCRSYLRFLVFPKICLQFSKSVYSLKVFWKRSREHKKHFLFQHESGMSPPGLNFKISEKKPRQRETQSKIWHAFKSAAEILGENLCSVLLSIIFNAQQVQLKKSLAWGSSHCWWWPPTPRDSPALPWVKVGHQLSPQRHDPGGAQECLTSRPALTHFH